jgi:hypothetical protein
MKLFPKKRKNMKIKSILLIGLIASLALLSSACSTATPAPTLEGDEKEKVVAIVDPFMQHILEGLQKKDYDTFMQDFDSVTAGSITVTQFNTIADSLSGLGAFKSDEVQSVESIDQYYRVNYKVTYEKGSFTMRLVIPKEGTPMITGLWFK